jgi:invasion protein IalB
MDHGLAFAPARPAACALAVATAAIMLTSLIGSTALAQTPPAPPAPPAPKDKAAPPKAAPPKDKAAKDKDKDKAAAPKAAQKPAEGGATPQINFVYSPWTKVCQKLQDVNSKQVCVTAKDARLEDGRPAGSAAVMEMEGENKKLLRVMLPIGVTLQAGSRVIVDEGQPMTAYYDMCQPVGCFSQVEASVELIGKLKKGQNLFLQAVLNNQPITVQIPLVDFAKAFEGPPVDPQMWESQQRKLQEELQRRAEEARKRLEAQQPKQ